MRKSNQIKQLKTAIVQVLKTVGSLEKSVRKSERRLDAARRAVPEALAELEMSENERIYLSVQYDQVMDTSPRKNAVNSAKLERSRARNALTQAKARLDAAKSELSALLK